MFKMIQVPKKIFDLSVIRPKSRATYSVREDYFCPVDDVWKEYRAYKGVIESVNEDCIRFVSDNTHVNFCSDSEHPDIDIWLSVEDIDGYWTKLELET